MSKTLTKTELLGKFAKHFAAVSETESVLKGIHYAENGEAFVTNRHYALRIHDVHSLSQPMTLDAKTGQPIDGIYPLNYSKVFPISFKTEIMIQQEAVQDTLLAAQCAAAVASRLNKKIPVVRMEVRSGGVFLCIHDELRALELSVRLSDAPIRSQSIRTLNGEYLVTALAIFDAAYSPVTLKVNGPFDPIVLSNDTGVEVLILPYRTQT